TQTHLTGMLPPSRPISKPTVRELLIEAGHDVSAWDTKIDGTPIRNPNDNMSRSAAWSFPGQNGEPLVACIWFNKLTLTEHETLYEGSDRACRQELIDRDKGEAQNDVRERLRRWTKNPLALDSAIQDAFRHRQPLRLILVVGNENHPE